jgi:hypothetical protein
MSQQITVSTVQTTTTRPHRTVSVGWQHADDQGPSVQCVVCGVIGEPGALLDLLPNAYGCAGRNLDED